MHPSASTAARMSSKLVQEVNKKVNEHQTQVKSTCCKPRPNPCGCMQHGHLNIRREGESVMPQESSAAAHLQVHSLVIIPLLDEASTFMIVTHQLLGKWTSWKRWKRKTDNGKTDLTVRLEWTGLTQNSVKCLFQCRTEASILSFLESVEVKGQAHI